MVRHIGRLAILVMVAAAVVVGAGDAHATVWGNNDHKYAIATYDAGAQSYNAVKATIEVRTGAITQADAGNYGFILQDLWAIRSSNEWVESGVYRGWPSTTYPHGDASLEVLFWASKYPVSGGYTFAKWYMYSPTPIAGSTNEHKFKSVDTSGNDPWTIYINGAAANSQYNTVWLSGPLVRYVEAGIETNASSGVWGATSNPAFIDTIRRSSNGGANWGGIVGASLTYNQSSPWCSWAGWASGQEGTKLLNYRLSSD